MSEAVESEAGSEGLRWRRQFLLSNETLCSLSKWQHLEVGGRHLYVHPDLELHKASNGITTLVLLGYIFDATDTEKGTRQIFLDIAAEVQTFESLLTQVKPYAGRYVFIYIHGDDCRLFHDPLGLREIYYCVGPNRIVCGSQPNLISHFADPDLPETTDSSTRHFYEEEFTNGKWVGDGTYYNGIKHLLPNHCLNAARRAARRYWPQRRIEPVQLEEAVEKSCAFLQGMLRAAVHRQKVMIAVTAGLDSRTLLAAARPIVDKIYFFVNKERDLTDRSTDIRIPSLIFSSLGLSFHVHDVPQQVDPKFRQIFLENTFCASERILPTIYNVYFRDHPDKLNVLGIGEIGRNRYGKSPRRLNPYRMAYLIGYKNSQFAREKCSELRPGIESAAAEFNLNAATLLYWEQTMGNWGAVGNSESDIAIEEFDPFDSHALYETLLGVAPKYARYTSSVVFKEMIKKMWPELLQWPINPPGGGAKAKVVSVSKKLGVYYTLKNIKFRMHHFGRIMHLATRGRRRT